MILSHKSGTHSFSSTPASMGLFTNSPLMNGPSANHSPPVRVRGCRSTKLTIHSKEIKYEDTGLENIKIILYSAKKG